MGKGRASLPLASPTPMLISAMGLGVWAVDEDADGAAVVNDDDKRE